MKIEKIIDAVIDRRATISQSLCVCYRTPKGDCSLCVDACPVQTIRVDSDGPKIGADCVDCGVCYATCPSGAFGVIQGEDDIVIAGFSRTTTRGTRRISCMHGEGGADLVLPCLGRLTEAILLHLLLEDGTETIEILRPGCDSCQMQRAMANFNTFLQGVTALGGVLGIPAARRIAICEIPWQLKVPLDTSENPASRREFLQALTKKGGRLASSSLATGSARDQPTAAILEVRPTNRKRAELLRVLNEGIKDHEVSVIEVAAAVSLTAGLMVDSHCIACGVCESVCPAAALSENKTDGKFTLLFRADLCVNCGVCARVCMPGAIQYSDTVELNSLLESAEKELFSAASKVCTACKLDFIGQGHEGICPLCMDRYKRQQNVLKQIFSTEEL